MNGEVSVLIDEVDNVIAVPNDAIKNPREAVATGAMLGLNADSVKASLRAQGFTGGGNRGGFGGRRGGARRWRRSQRRRAGVERRGAAATNGATQRRGDADRHRVR